jgi:hypothetical protein
MLEIVDSSFDAISKEIDQYKPFLDSKTISQIEKIEIDSISVNKFIDYIAHRHKINFRNANYPDVVIREIKEAGVSTVGDLKKHATPAFIRAYKARAIQPHAASFLRFLILYENMGNLDVMRSVKTFTPNAIDFLAQKHGRIAVEKELAKRGIIIRQPAEDPLPKSSPSKVKPSVRKPG